MKYRVMIGGENLVYVKQWDDADPTAQDEVGVSPEIIWKALEASRNVIAAETKKIIHGEEVTPIGKPGGEEAMDEVIQRRIAQERKRQDEKWGKQNHSDAYWCLILLEEVGEASKCILQGRSDIKLEHEVVQAAAVAVAWLENKKRERAKQREEITACL